MRLHQMYKLQLQWAMLFAHRCLFCFAAGIVGPALSALDAHIGYVLGAATRAKDARRAAQHAAAAQEARAMLGAPDTAAWRFLAWCGTCTLHCRQSTSAPAFMRSSILLMLLLHKLGCWTDVVCVAGLTQEQARALAELFGGQHSLLGRPRRACIADLIAFLVHRSQDQRLWPQLCTVGSRCTLLNNPVCCAVHLAAVAQHQLPLGNVKLLCPCSQQF